MGFECKKAEAVKLIEEHDPSGSGYIGYDDFVSISAVRIAQRSPAEEMKKAFELFDEDGTGKISLRNLRHIARELGENLTDDDLQAMIQEFDKDEDGQISLEEFAGIMDKASLYE